MGEQLRVTAAAQSAHLPQDATSARFEHARLRASVTVRTEVAAKTTSTKSEVLRPVEIVADEMVVRGKSNTAVFTGHVVVDRDDYHLTCEKLTVSYDRTHRVERLVAEGAVRVVQGGRIVTSQRAEFDNHKEILVLTGDPVMVEGENRVRGEVITFDLTTDEVRVTRVRASVKMKDLR